MSPPAGPTATDLFGPEAEHWEFDVLTAHHDDVKGGGLATCRPTRSRVVLSREYTYATAKDLAGALAVAMHGGMPIEIRWRC